MEALTLEQLISKAPAIAAQKPSDKVTSIYTHIPSTRVIKDISELGWTPVAARQRKNHIVDSTFAQHQIDFRIDNPISVSNDADVIFPQVTFINSHDGKSTFRFYAGLFRLVCSNGLSIPMKAPNGESLGESFKIRHSYYDIDSLAETMKNVIVSIKNSMEPIFKLNSTNLSNEQAQNLAKRGLAIREGITREHLQKFLDSIPDETVADILRPKREMDGGRNAWRVFNTIQESMMKGDFYLPVINKKGKEAMRKVRPLNDMVKTQKINVQLFEQAQLILN
jgi:hypothetical protein